MMTETQNAPTQTVPAKKPKLAIFDRHSLLDGRGAGYTLAPGNEYGHAFLGGWPHNVGDQFVASALGRALDFDEFYTLTREATPAQFDFVNSECSAVIAVMQNAMFPGFFGSRLPVSYLKQIKIPIIMISLGLQFRFGDEIHLTPEDVDSLKWLHDHAVSSQVRGELSAELLARYGIHNTRVLGCPSLLWTLNRTPRIRKPTWDNVGFTITDMGRLPNLHRYQFDIIEQAFARARRFSLIAQGGEWVLQDYLTTRDAVHPSVRTDALIDVSGGTPIEHARPAHAGPLQPGELMKSVLKYNALADKERSLDWYYRELPDEIRQNFKENAFFSSHLPEYIRRSRDLSATIGTRLHGNIIALSQGTPAYYSIHDYRLKDMVEFLKLPHVSFETGTTAIDFEAADYGPYERLVPELFDGFAAFFEENGLMHRLPKNPDSLFRA